MPFRKMYNITKTDRRCKRLSLRKNRTNHKDVINHPTYRNTHKKNTALWTSRQREPSFSVQTKTRSIPQQNTVGGAADFNTMHSQINQYQFGDAGPIHLGFI